MQSVAPTALRSLVLGRASMEMDSLQQHHTLAQTYTLLSAHAQNTRHQQHTLAQNLNTSLCSAWNTRASTTPHLGSKPKHFFLLSMEYQSINNTTPWLKT